MKSTTIIVHNKATLTSEGVHNSSISKPLIAIDIHKTFNSRLDAAEFFGVHPTTIYNVLNGTQPALKMYERDEHGNKVRCIGKCRLKDASEHDECIDMLMDHAKSILNEHDKMKQKLAEQEAEMKEFRAWKAEKEAIRKAEEKRLAEINDASALVIKLEDKLARRNRMVDRRETELMEAVARRDETIRELAEAKLRLEELKGE